MTLTRQGSTGFSMAKTQQNYAKDHQNKLTKASAKPPNPLFESNCGRDVIRDTELLVEYVIDCYRCALRLVKRQEINNHQFEQDTSTGRGSSTSPPERTYLLKHIDVNRLVFSFLLHEEIPSLDANRDFWPDVLENFSYLTNAVPDELELLKLPDSNLRRLQGSSPRSSPAATRTEGFFKPAPEDHAAGLVTQQGASTAVEAEAEAPGPAHDDDDPSPALVLPPNLPDQISQAQLQQAALQLEQREKLLSYELDDDGDEMKNDDNHNSELLLPQNLLKTNVPRLRFYNTNAFSAEQKIKNLFGRRKMDVWWLLIGDKPMKYNNSASSSTTGRSCAATGTALSSPPPTTDMGQRHGMDNDSGNYSKKDAAMRTSDKTPSSSTPATTGGIHSFLVIHCRNGFSLLQAWPGKFAFQEWIDFEDRLEFQIAEQGDEAAGRPTDTGNEEGGLLARQDGEENLVDASLDRPIGEKKRSAKDHRWFKRFKNAMAGKVFTFDRFFALLFMFVSEILAPVKVSFPEIIVAKKIKTEFKLRRLPLE
ncbi:unnamed protein product [Amoebophrya sp. A120]|nr:unnamed protein product [Amoebophrya sp. A120]|eukprot:GSA120T00013519001.1